MAKTKSGKRGKAGRKRQAQSKAKPKRAASRRASRRKPAARAKSAARPRRRAPVRRARQAQPQGAVFHRRVTSGRSQAAPAKQRTHARSQVTPAGSTAHFQVSYLTSLGQLGATLANALLQNCERDYSTLQQIFGGLTTRSLPFVVEVTADNSGASHATCLGTAIAVGGKSGGSVDFIRSLLVAEEDEVFMANYGRGWNCGFSNGEGLSRVLASDIYPGVEPADFVSSDVWLNLDPRPNWVDTTERTDQDYNSIGCSVLFLNWLRFQLGHSWSEIVAAGAATLAGTYQNLTGSSTAWQDFEAFMNAHFPTGTQYNLGTDNPFPV